MVFDEWARLSESLRLEALTQKERADRAETRAERAERAAAAAAQRPAPAPLVAPAPAGAVDARQLNLAVQQRDQALKEAAEATILLAESREQAALYATEAASRESALRTALAAAQSKPSAAADAALVRAELARLQAQVASEREAQDAMLREWAELQRLSSLQR